MDRSTFTNRATGTINIERVNGNGINHSVSTFTNNGTITMGISSTVGSYAPSIYNSATLVNGPGAVLLIDHSLRSGIHSSDDSFPISTSVLLSNAGLIEIGKNVSGGIYGLRNSGTLTNQLSGTITIDHVSGNGSWGLYTNSNPVTNAGKIIIGSSSSAGNTGLYNYSNFTNSGEISIDHIVGASSTHGFYNGVSSGTATLNNTGRITIGSAASIGDWGLLNQATINNNAGGEISINRALKEGLRTQGSSTTFTNSGQLFIGNIASVGDWGLFNYDNALFNNNAGGQLSINRSAMTGLRTQGTLTKFTNSGQMAIGNIASVGDWGLWNEATFINKGGAITVDRSTEADLVNGSFTSATFTNGISAKLSIGTLAATSDVGLFNASTSIFSNSACAMLTLYESLSNAGTFSNQGILVVNTPNSHNNAGFTNNGVINYLQANLIPNVTNNDLIIVPNSTSCSLANTPTLLFGPNNSFSVATTWYKDAGLTQPAGTYDPATNTFTRTDASGSPLWFSVTDNLNNCAQTILVSVAPSTASIQSLSVSGVLGSPNCVVELTGLATGNVFTFTGPDAYVFSNVYRNAGTYRVFGLNVIQPGVYTLRANLLDNCGQGTPISQTITVGGTKCP